MATLLTCDNLSKQYGLRHLFTDISFVINDGAKIGLIGPNGAGKSTLLKIFAEEESADEGEVTLKRQLGLSYVAQQDSFAADATVESVLLEGLASDAFDETEKQVLVDIMIGKVGYLRREQLAETLSGGWKKRLAISKALIAEPELLLLDEPTNHLDLEGILWLEGLLKSASFAFILISHDRYLLENVCSRIIEINRAYPDGFYSVDGKYSDYLLRREDFLNSQTNQQQSLNAKVRQEVAWLKRGARARTTKAKGRIEDAMQLIDELDAVKERNSQNRKVAIGFEATGRKTKRLLVARQISKNMNNISLFKKLDIILGGGIKLGILGPNGSGKTTLLRLLAGELIPDEGSIHVAEGLRIVYFQQNRDELDYSVTLRESLAPGGDTLSYQGQSIHVAGWAKKFLFTPEQLGIKVSELSGGEQSRILIARMMLQPADILILDEPTNDLDIPSLEVLEDSLINFPGTVVLVTHDRFMLDRLCDLLLSLDGEGNAEYFAEYAQWERNRDNKNLLPTSTVSSDKLVANKAPVKISGSNKLTWKEAREFASMEESIMAAEAEVERLNMLMQSPEINSDYMRVSKTMAELDSAEKTVTALYSRWEELAQKEPR